MAFKGKVKVNLNMPVLKFQRELEVIAQRVIRADIQNRMRKGIGIDEAAHRPNSPSTRSNKAKRGLRSEVPLVASGQLVSSFRINLVGNNAVKIFPAGLRKPYPRVRGGKRRRKITGNQEQPTNNELADILQNKGVGKSGHTYDFFGISDKAEVKSIKMLQRFIKEAIKRGGRKTIR